MKLSLIMPYYRNPSMLRRHLRLWRDEWSDVLKNSIEIVLVDDGSPEERAFDVLKGWHDLPPLSLFCVLEDRPWHQHGARNLGAHVAVAPWFLMTDMDHLVPAQTLAEVLRLIPSLSDTEVVTFGRVDAPPSKPFWTADQWTEFKRTRREDGTLKPHVNSFLVHRDRYWKLGGYDEELCGIYGTDSDFRKRLFSKAIERHLAHAPLIRVDRDVIEDASTRGVERKTPDRVAKKLAVDAKKKLEGRSGTTTTLNFPWQRVL